MLRHALHKNAALLFAGTLGALRFCAFPVGFALCAQTVRVGPLALFARPSSLRCNLITPRIAGSAGVLATKRVGLLCKVFTGLLCRALFVHAAVKRKVAELAAFEIAGRTAVRFCTRGKRPISDVVTLCFFAALFHARFKRIAPHLVAGLFAGLAPTMILRTGSKRLVGFKATRLFLAACIHAGGKDTIFDLVTGLVAGGRLYVAVLGAHFKDHVALRFA